MKLIARYFKWFPVFMAVLWMVIRVIAGKSSSVEHAPIAGALTNILFILLIIFAAIVVHYKNLEGERQSFLGDVKTGMKPALIYVLIVVGYMALYYGVMSDEMPKLKELRTKQFAEMVDSDEEVIAALHTQDPSYANLSQEQLFNAIRNQKYDNNSLSDAEIISTSREQLLANNKAQADMIISVKAHVLLALLALVVSAFFYSLLATFFWRTFVKRI
jgi:hypothetical protein